MKFSFKFVDFGQYRTLLSCIELFQNNSVVVLNDLRLAGFMVSNLNLPHTQEWRPNINNFRQKKIKYKFVLTQGNDLVPIFTQFSSIISWRRHNTLMEIQFTSYNCALFSLIDWLRIPEQPNYMEFALIFIAKPSSSNDSCAYL